MIIFEAVLNRFRVNGVIKHFGTLKMFDKEIEVKFVGNHLYGLWIALVLGIATMNVWLGLAILVAYLVGEAKGWENQEIVYGAIQGSVMWYIILGVIH